MPTWRRSGRTGCRRAGPLSVRGPRNRRRAAHGVGRRDIRVVEKPCDTAETLRLALREIAVAGTIEAGKAGVRVGVDTDDGLQREGIGNVGDGQRIRRRGKKHFFAVDRNTQRFQFLAIEDQRLRGDGRVAAHRQRGVVLEINGLRGVGFHRLSSIRVGSADDTSRRRGRLLWGAGCVRLEAVGARLWGYFRCRPIPAIDAARLDDCDAVFAAVRQSASTQCRASHGPDKCGK